MRRCLECASAKDGGSTATPGPEGPSTKRLLFLIVLAGGAFFLAATKGCKTVFPRDRWWLPTGETPPRPKVGALPSTHATNLAEVVVYLVKPGEQAP